MKCPDCGKRLSSFDRQRGLSAHFVCEPDVNNCPQCGEPLTKVTLSSIRCRCLQPSMPSPCKPGCKLVHMHRTAESIERQAGKVSMQVRYGN